MSAWSDYKNRLGETRPWDLLNPNAPKSSPELQEQRLETCRGCDRFVKLTSQCKECGCVMIGKVKLQDAKCPLDKWVA